MRLPKRIMSLLGFLMGVLFYLLESMLHAYVFHDSQLWQEIFSPKPHELWMRGIVALMLIIFGFCADHVISLRRRSEEVVRKREELYRTFVQNFQGIAYRCRMDFTPVFFHGAVQEITGYAESDFQSGEPLWDEMIHPDDFPGLEESIEKIARFPGYVTSREYRIIRKNGEIRWVHEHVKNLCDDSGMPALVEGFIFDITRRREMEEEILRSNRVKGLFIDILDHDLMNKVIALKNLAVVASDRCQEHEILEYFYILENNARKLEELIRGALSLSKISDLKRIIKGEVDLAVKVREVVEEFRAEARRKKIKLDFKAGGQTVAWVNHTIGLVFWNIVSNAIKYSPERGRVEVELKEEDGNCHFSVADNGEGIPDEFKESIFERFIRKSREGVKGTGLGLAIVKSVVELHKGRAWVEDNPAGGSIFHIVLPRN